MTMTGEDVKRDFDQDYRLRVVEAAKEVLEGNDLPEDREVVDLYPEVITSHANGDGEYDEMSERLQRQDIEEKKREIQAALVGARIGVEASDVLELVKLLEGMEQ